MRRIHVTFMMVAAVMLAVIPLRAAVRVDSGEAKEKTVALRTPERKYITANPGGSLDLTGTKIGSKQTFILIDLNGGELEDGDAVKIRYVPNTGGKPDPSKASFWLETKEGVKRGRDGDVFKVKRVETKYVFQTSSGKFVGAPVDGGLLAVADKQRGALLVELVDPATGAAASDTAKQPPAEEAAASAPEEAATE